MTSLAPAPNVPNPRNAGRKKSNPVWEFFTDLRMHGLAGVRCRFCHWVTNDRSPTTMKFHLKRKHDSGPGGLWALCEEKISQQAPANYAPRKRPEPTKIVQHQQSHTPSISDSLLSRTLSSLPNMLWPNFDHSATATVNIGVNSHGDDFLASLIQQATSMAASSSPPELSVCKPDDVENINGVVKHEDVENMNLAEQFMLRSSDVCKNSDQSSDASYPMQCNEFSLADGASIAGLLQIATDSDLTFTFNARRSGEYCFESNRPERKGRMVVFSDLGGEIRVGQRVDGEEISDELWRKSDWTQFCWAVRGTCLHFLKTP